MPDKYGIDWPLMQNEVEDYFGDPHDPDFRRDWIVRLDLGVLKSTFAHLQGLQGSEINLVMIPPLLTALGLVADQGLEKLLKTWDGRWVIRPTKGGKMRYSMHAYALADDFNAATNAFGSKPTMPHSIVKCFAQAGFEWGGLWKPDNLRDGMHLQLPWIKIRTGPLAPVVYQEA